MGFLPGALGSPPLWSVTVGAGLVGLVVGSFLNVVIYRVPRHLSVARPPSFCPICASPVRAVDNVPLFSWIALGGRCRHCRAPISARYPAVEAGTGTLFAVLALVVGPHWAIPGLCVLGATLAASSAIELDGSPAPRTVAVVGAAVAVPLLAGAAVADHRWGGVVGGAVGVVVGVGLTTVARVRPLSVVARARVTEGAVLVPAGMVLGWTGLVGSASGAGAVVVCSLIWRSRGRLGPALWASAACVVGLASALGQGVVVGR